jgi:hypothetical protein
VIYVSIVIQLSMFGTKISFFPDHWERCFNSDSTFHVWNKQAQTQQKFWTSCFNSDSTFHVWNKVIFVQKDMITMFQ